MVGQIIRMHFWTHEFTTEGHSTWQCRGCDSRLVVNERDRPEPVNAGSPPTVLEMTLSHVPKSCPRTVQKNRPACMLPTTHLVIIAREGAPDVTEFSNYEEAERFFESASFNWTESYLTVVIAGPGRPLVRTENPYCTAPIIALRKIRGAELCSDEHCTLSGGYAHVGPCETCLCPLKHAVDECPEAKR